MKVNLLHLSALSVKPNENGDKKIQKSKEGKGESRDTYGRSREFYTENNLPIPTHLFESSEEDLEYDEEGLLLLDDEDIKYEASPLIIDLLDFSYCSDSDKIGSMLVTKSGEAIDILESSFEVYSQIDWMNKSWVSRNWEDFKYWVSNKKETENGLQD